MKKGFMMALAFIALTSAPALASVQNVKISGDIDSTWLVRDQFDLGIDDVSKSFYQNMLITQTRLRVDSDLTDKVSATVALINERVWGEDREDNESASATGGSNDVDLNLAYATMREMLYSPLTVVIGRQNFAFGNSLVIDSAGSNNTVSTGGIKGAAEDLSKRTALDAVRLTFDYNPLTIDVIAAKVDANVLAGGTQIHDDDVDLFGINTNYQLGDSMDSVVEGYFWAKIDQSVKTAAPGSKADTVYMPGIRASTNPIKGLNTQIELAAQSGSKQNPSGSATNDNVDRKAVAGQFITNYMLPFESTANLAPVVTGAYTYTSGDSGPTELGNRVGGDGRDTYTAWDPMFENQGGGTIYNTLFDLTNMHIVTARTQMKPLEDLTAILEWNAIIFDKQLNDIVQESVNPDEGVCSGSDCLTMRQPDGSTLNPRMTSNRKAGDEFGLRFIYDYTEDVKLGYRADWFIPGNAFESANDNVAFQSLLNANVIF
jgi:hypothetical protein